MKLRQLFEARDEELFKRNYDKLVAHLKQHCKKNLNVIASSDYALWRGDAARGPYRMADGYMWFPSIGRTNPRVSTTDNNLLLFWTSQSPLWKNFPIRSLSTPCAAAYDDAIDFGNNTFLLIPHDSVSLYGATREDFNLTTISKNGFDPMSFMGLISTAQAEMYELGDREELSPELAEIQAHDGFEVGLGDLDSMRDLKELSAAFEELAQFYHSGPEAEEEIDDLARDALELILFLEGDTILKALDKWINPSKLGAKAYTDLAKLLEEGGDKFAEVWFQGPYVSLTVEANHPAPMKLKDSAWFKQLVDDVNS
jgi:hypothetical protein